jgi:nitroreductase
MGAVRHPGPLIRETAVDNTTEVSMLRDLVVKNRSYRRWHQDVAMESEALRELVDLARLSPSAANRQALKFILSNDSQKNAMIFPNLRIDNDPIEGERPSAYVIILHDTGIQAWAQVDLGIAAQTIHLGAVEKGFGGVMVGNIDKDGLRKALDIPAHLEILLVLALGKPKEEMVIETMGADGSIQQWWDDSRARHVIKRPLSDLVVE